MIAPTLTPELAAFLVCLAFVAGIGIATVGPGGIFVTVALFLFVPISSAEVAGTASATFVGTGLLGTVLFRRSGDLTTGATREMALLLSATSVAGAYLGARANVAVPDAVFGSLLAAFVAVIGTVIVYRERVGLEPRYRFDRAPARRRRLALGVVGTGVGGIGGLLGVGGPVLAVPILVVLGVPMLASLAVAQVQSVFIAGVATVGYWTGGSVLVGLGLLVGVPQLLGVVVGWRLAHVVDEGRLRTVLGVVLVGVSPVIAL